jgi:hypothetical protein
MFLVAWARVKALSSIEGVWDAESAALTTGWIQKVEEEGMDSNGFIPEASRAVIKVFDMDWKSKSVRLGCMSKGETGGGNEVYRGKDWSGSLACAISKTLWMVAIRATLGGGTIRSGLQFE